MGLSIDFWSWKDNLRIFKSADVVDVQILFLVRL